MTIFADKHFLKNKTPCSFFCTPCFFKHLPNHFPIDFVTSFAWRFALEPLESSGIANVARSDGWNLIMYHRSSNPITS